MTAAEFLDILHTAAKLKTTLRHCYTEGDRQESVADHSWRLALMALLLRDVEDFRGLDMDRVIRMCLIHDLGEAFTGDIPAFRKSDEEVRAEDDRFAAWIDRFPCPQRAEWAALLSEMFAQESGEARLFKALDKLEALISHNESDVDTWLPLEHELQLRYGQEEMQPFPYLISLRERIDDWTLRKTAAAQDPESADPRQP